MSYHVRHVSVGDLRVMAGRPADINVHLGRFPAVDDEERLIIADAGGGEAFAIRGSARDLLHVAQQIHALFEETAEHPPSADGPAGPRAALDRLRTDPR